MTPETILGFLCV